MGNDTVDKLPTLAELYDDLCMRVRQVKAKWNEIGHVWSQGIVFTSFARMAPRGVCYTCERPAKLSKSKHLDFVWTKGDSFVDRHAKLLLVLESQWQHQNGAINRWQDVVFGDIDKILAENVPIAVLVTARSQEPEKALVLLRAKTQQHDAGNRQAILIVMLSPPQGKAASCMARAMAFELGQTEPTRFGPTEC
jgi:hypothetical protein